MLRARANGAHISPAKSLGFPPALAWLDVAHSRIDYWIEESKIEIEESVKQAFSQFNINPRDSELERANFWCCFCRRRIEFRQQLA